MIDRKGEEIVEGVRVGHIIEVRSVEQTRDQDGIEDPSIGDRVLDKPSVAWSLTSEGAVRDDYHAGLTRGVPRYQSNYLAREGGMEHLGVWNERAVSVCIAQELGFVAYMLGLEKYVKSAGVERLHTSTGLNTDFLGSADEGTVARAVLAVAVGCNILLDDPLQKLRPLMANGNILGFLQRAEEIKSDIPSVIISSYNTPCTKPGKRLMEIFPVIGQVPPLAHSFPIRLQQVLGPCHGWVGGIFSGGRVNTGDEVFVNIAPTTPPLPEE